MVDLAGSEREVVGHGGPSDARRGHERVMGGGGADGRTTSQRLTLSQRLRETAQIKKALSNLGIIIKGLSRGDTPVGLPFRDSILTWLLKVGRIGSTPVPNWGMLMLMLMLWLGPCRSFLLWRSQRDGIIRSTSLSDVGA